MSIRFRTYPKTVERIQRERGERMVLFGIMILLMANFVSAESVRREEAFPSYLRDNFDYAAFTRFDAPRPPKDIIYQSNGFMALQELGFGEQKIMIPVAGWSTPINASERLAALEVDAPVFVDSSRRIYRLADSPARRSMTYFADRTVYRAHFVDGPEVSLTVYPVYGSPAAVFRIKIARAHGLLNVILRSRGDGFQVIPGGGSAYLKYGSSRWPYRAVLAARPKGTIHGESFQWSLHAGRSAALMISSDGTEPEAKAALRELEESPDLFDSETHQLWNKYLASTPLVAPATSIRFTVGTSGRQRSIAPQELVRSELWLWRGLLNDTCQVSYLPACPMMIADWNVFMGMWSNDGIAETIQRASV